MTTRDERDATSNSSGWSAFRGDLSASVAALGAAPLLLVLTVVLSVAVSLKGAFLIVALPLFLVEAGFVGTQRVWFARVYRGEQLRGGEVAPLTRSFVGRFVVLGLVVSLVVSPIVLVAGALNTRAHPLVVVVFVLVAITLDVALTFVVPALALTTGSVRTAIRIGLRMIKEAWPQAAWYLLTPGLTLGLVGTALGVSSYRPNGPLHIAIVMSTAVLAVWFKGAIVAFYVRQPQAPQTR